MKKLKKIHFVHHLEKGYVPPNLGDWICSPYYYFTEYFSRYTCVLHSDWAILWHEIERDDIVIFGGGGLLDNSDELNRVLNRLLHANDNVIIWGAGTHRYGDGNIFGKKAASEPIKYERAAFVGVRDYQHPSELPYLPCVSCLNSAFTFADKNSLIKRKIGTVKSALERSFAVAGLPSSVTNAEPIGVVVDYIISSEVILVSSYHGAYWSMLLGRKAILPSTRLAVDKYKYFRHPVGFYGGTEFVEQEILELANQLPEIPDFLAESQRLNHEFFQRCRLYIESRIEPASENNTIQIIAKRNAQLEFTVIDMWGVIGKLNHRITLLESDKSRA
jgi:hypothetical protein